MVGIFNLLFGGSVRERQDIVYVGGKTADGGSSTGNLTIDITDLTGGVASLPGPNDIVVVSYNRGSSGRSDADLDVIGFTEVADLFVNDTFEADFYIGYKVMGSNPDASITITRPDAGNYAVAIQVFRNVDQTTPLDVVSTTSTSLDTGRPDPPAITPITDKTVIVAAGGAGRADTDSAVFTSSDLTNFITRARNGLTSGSTIGMGTKLWTGGEFNPAQFGGGTTSTSAASAAATLALRAGYPPTAGTYKDIFQFSAATTSTSTSITLPSNLQENDIVIILSVSVDSNVNLPTGYTNGQNGFASMGYRWSYKIMGSTPDTTASGLSNSCLHLAFALRNVDTTTPLDVSSPTVSTGTNASPNSPSITSVTEKAMILSLGFCDSAVTAVSAPTNYTLVGQVAQEYVNEEFAGLLVARFLSSTAGTYDPGAFTSSNNNDFVGATIALRPAIN